MAVGDGPNWFHRSRDPQMWLILKCIILTLYTVEINLGLLCWWKWFMMVSSQLSHAVLLVRSLCVTKWDKIGSVFQFFIIFDWSLFSWIMLDYLIYNLSSWNIPGLFGLLSNNWSSGIFCLCGFYGIFYFAAILFCWDVCVCSCTHMQNSCQGIYERAYSS